MQAKTTVFTQQDWRLLSVLETRQFNALKGITDEMSKNITRVLTDSAAAGLGANKTAEAIQAATGMAYRRAETIARTEFINGAAQAARSKYEELGVKEYEFLAASDSRVCGICAQYNGKIYPIDDTEHLPPIHPNCRCAIAPVIGNRKKEILEAEKRKAEAERLKKEKEAAEKKEEEELKKEEERKRIEEEKKEEERKKIEEFKAKTKLLRENYAKRLNNVKTFEAIEKSESCDDILKNMKARYDQYHNFGDNFDVIDGEYKRVTIAENIMFEALKESIVKADAVYKDIPLLSKHYNTTSLFENTYINYDVAYAGSNGFSIFFGKHYRNDYGMKNLLADLKMDFESHWHPSDKLESNYIHELGHCAEYLYGDIVTNGNMTSEKWNSHYYATEILKEAITRIEKRKYGEAHIPALDDDARKKYWKQISRYASSKNGGDKEAVAEAFADYYCNGDKAKEISKEIIKIIIEAVN